MYQFITPYIGIQNKQLTHRVSLDCETDAVVRRNVEVKEQAGLTFSKDFDIAVTDVYEAHRASG